MVGPRSAILDSNMHVAKKVCIPIYKKKINILDLKFKGQMVEISVLCNCFIMTEDTLFWHIIFENAFECRQGTLSCWSKAKSSMSLTFNCKIKHLKYNCFYIVLKWLNVKTSFVAQICMSARNVTLLTFKENVHVHDPHFHCQTKNNATFLYYSKWLKLEA